MLEWKKNRNSKIKETTVWMAEKATKNNSLFNLISDGMNNVSHTGGSNIVKLIFYQDL